MRAEYNITAAAHPPIKWPLHKFLNPGFKWGGMVQDVGFKKSWLDPWVKRVFLDPLWQ
jgi:hypothetical protein